jgi:tetratricopeptide (TPR) repeat protein
MLDRIRRLWFSLLHTMRPQQRTNPIRKAFFKTFFAFIISSSCLVKRCWRAFPAFIARLISLVAIAYVAYFFIPQIHNPPTIIDDISVPKAFEENGFTATVASERLQDAINSIVTEAAISPGMSITEMAYLRDSATFVSNYDLERERPNIIVPGVGFSTESIASLIAFLVHAHRFSGEIVAMPGKRLSLTLRQDGKAFGTLISGPVMSPDELLKTGAREILEQQRPSILADILRLEGKRDEAFAEDRKAIQINPSDAFAHDGLGIDLDGMGKRNEATAEYRESLRLDPHNASAHNGLGIILQEEGKRDEAIAEFRNGIRLDPHYAPPHYNLGNLLRDEGKRDEAIAEYHETLRLETRHAPVYNNLGAVLYEEGKRDEATAEFREAIRLDPHYAVPHHNLGIVLRDKGRRDEATAEFRDAIRLDPHYAPAHYNLGNTLMDEGKRDEAIAEFRETVRLAPYYAPTHNKLGILLDEEGKHDEALVEYREARKLRSNALPK